MEGLRYGDRLKGRLVVAREYAEFVGDDEMESAAAIWAYQFRTGATDLPFLEYYDTVDLADLAKLTETIMGDPMSPTSGDSGTT